MFLDGKSVWGQSLMAGCTLVFALAVYGEEQEEKSREDKTRQDKRREDKTRQDTTT